MRGLKITLRWKFYQDTGRYSARWQGGWYYSGSTYTAIVKVSYTDIVLVNVK